MSNSKNGPGGLIVFAGPSGAGKTTIIRSLMERIPELVFSISSTTRPRREGEQEGVDYDFLSDTAFDRAVEEGDFIEWEHVHLHRYGTRKSRVSSLIGQGYTVVFDLDVLGALSLKGLYPDALLLYIDVLSPDVLAQRLRERGRDSSAEIQKRLQRYEMERARADQFDHRIVNGDLEETVEQVVAWVRTYLESVRK